MSTLFSTSIHTLLLLQVSISGGFVCLFLLFLVFVLYLFVVVVCFVFGFYFSFLKDGKKKERTTLLKRNILLFFYFRHYLQHYSGTTSTITTEIHWACTFINKSAVIINCFKSHFNQLATASLSTLPLT